MAETPKTPPTTTDAGIPVQSDEHSLTVGRNGPISSTISGTATVRAVRGSGGSCPAESNSGAK